MERGTAQKGRAELEHRPTALPTTMAESTQRSTRSTENRTDPIPMRRYVPLGVDATGAHHLWAAATETIHVIGPDGSRDRYPNVAGDELEEWMAWVVRKVGEWQTRRYGVSLGERLAESLEASDDQPQSDTDAVEQGDSRVDARDRLRERRRRGAAVRGLRERGWD